MSISSFDSRRAVLVTGGGSGIGAAVARRLATDYRVAIWGDMEMGSLGDGDPDAEYRLVTKLVPQRRPGDPREIAEAVAWLLSPLASYMNGAVINVDGGAASVCASMTAFYAS